MALVWDSLVVALMYLVIAGYAIALLINRETPRVIRSASIVGLVVASWILIARLMIAIDPIFPELLMARFFLHPLMNRLRAYLGMLALLVIYAAVAHRLMGPWRGRK